MNYMVTGAAGFIGAALAKRLVDEGHNVVTIDNLSTGFEEHVPDGVEFIKGDVYDTNIIDGLKDRQFDAIFHVAGQSGGSTCWDDPIYDLNSNVTSTLLLLDYAVKTKVKSFVYASSMTVYGDEIPCPMRENDMPKPKGFYSVGKNASEQYMRVYSEEYGLKCTSLRLNNIYGPGQNMKNMMQGVVSIYLAYAIKDKHILSMGSKDRFRDFVYIDDTVRAFIMAANGKEESLFNIYNISTNTRTTYEELIAKMKALLPFDVSVEYKGRTRGDQFGIYCSYEKIFSSLGWKPEVDLDEGLKRMVDWALKLDEGSI